MFNFFDLEISQVFNTAEKEMFELNHPYVGTEHLLLSILKKSEELSSICKKYGLTYDSFKNELLSIIGSAKKKSIYILYTPLLKKVINTALSISKEEKTNLNCKHLLAAIINEGDGIAIRILLSMNIDIDALYDEIAVNKKNKTKLEILELGKDLSKYVDMSDIVIGREKELNLIIETLIRKNKNNPLLIGDAGVGKTAIVEELARRINNSNVIPKLRNKKIIVLEMGSLVAGTKYRGEFEERLTNIIKELENNDEYILFIDEIHSMANAGGAEGAINAADILKPYLARGTIKCIGATTEEEYNKYILKDKALSRRFEVINVLEPNVDETIEILKNIKNNYIKHYNINITNQNIKDIVSITNQFIHNKTNPDKSIDILDSVCASIILKKDDNKNIEYLKELNNKKQEYIKNNDFKNAVDIYKQILITSEQIDKDSNKRLSITKKDILDVIYNKCNIPKDIKQIFKKVNKKINSDLEVLLQKYINSFKQTNLLLTKTNDKDLNNLKSVLEELKIHLIELDMKEYSQDYQVNKLLGRNYEQESVLNSVINNPYSCLIIKNIEEASNDVRKIIEQIIDNGYITNNKKEKIWFKNTLIIITTNKNNYSNIGFSNKETRNYLFNKIDSIIEFDNSKNLNIVA